MNKNYYVAILAGGLGTRFWPKSRTSMPKQFLDILGSGQSLLQSTFSRYARFIHKENIFIITTEEYGGIVQEHLPDLPAENILCEPSRKNTAPCVALMAAKLYKMNPNAIFIVAPSDHLVKDYESFSSVATAALRFAETHDAFVTLGIEPTYPNTGYGYIQYDTSNVIENNVHKVKTFTEKPDLALAETFVKSGEFLWNAGIFAWKASTILHAFEIFQPEMYELFSGEIDNFNTPEEKNAIRRIYPLCINISIDFAIMEKVDNVFVIPCSVGWSDLGTWRSAYENMEKDYLENAVIGNQVIVFDAEHNMIDVPTNKMVVLQGLTDYIVVDTKDVLLICKKEKEQFVKEYLAAVKRLSGDKYI
jgi:mannose-1-phosphate guanylyltransferase